MDNGKAIRAVCQEFIELCGSLEMFTQALVAIDGSKLKTVNIAEAGFHTASPRKGHLL